MKMHLLRNCICLDSETAKIKPPGILYMSSERDNYLTAVKVNSNKMKSLNFHNPWFLSEFSKPLVLSLSPVAKINFEMTS